MAVVHIAIDVEMLIFFFVILFTVQVIVVVLHIASAAILLLTITCNPIQHVECVAKMEISFYVDGGIGQFWKWFSSINTLQGGCVKHYVQLFNMTSPPFTAVNIDQGWLFLKLPD